MGTITATGRTEFLDAAEALLRRGLPERALDKLFIYREDSTKEAILEPRYYELRALTGFLLADTAERFEDARGYLRDAGGLTMKIMEKHEEAFSAYFTQRSPRTSRGRKKRLIRLRLNIGLLISMSKELELDPLDRIEKWRSAH